MLPNNKGLPLPAFTIRNICRIISALTLAASAAPALAQSVIPAGDVTSVGVTDLYVGEYNDGTLTISNGGTFGSGTVHIGYAVGSTGVVTVDGAGSTLSGALYVGEQGNGTLTISNGGYAASGIIHIAADSNSDGTLNIGAAAGATPVAPGTLPANCVVIFGSGSGTIVFNHTNTTEYFFGQPINGYGTIDIENGTTVLSGGNTSFSGTIKVSNKMATGTKLNVYAPWQLGTSVLYLYANTALGLNSDFTLTNPIHIGGDPVFDVPTGNTVTSAGGISDTDPLNPGTLDKQGGGTLVLEGANTYTGATTVTEGILQAGEANTLSPDSEVTVASGATLDLNGFNQTVLALTNNGGTINRSGATLTVSGDYTGGGGTLTISGALNDSPLVVTGNATTGSTVIVITSDTPPVNTNVPVVQTGGTTAGAFTLAGGALQQTMGNYKYTLFLGDGTGGTVANTWYISAVQVTTVATASVPTLSETALALLALLLAGGAAVTGTVRRNLIR